MTRTEKRRAFVNLLIVVVGLGLSTFVIKQAWSSRTPQSPASPNRPSEAKKEAQILAAPELNDILKRRQQNVTILDIQEREKFRKEHIPGAINIPADELDARAEDELSKSDLIVIVDCACDGTNTASLVKHSTLVTLGFPNVAVLDEGLKAWKRSSFEIVVEKE
jgi:rhodanese-related sulfurtransferase